MDISGDEVNRAVQVLIETGLEKTWANYVILGVLREKPKNIAKLNEKDVQNFRNVAAGCKEQSQMAIAKLIRGFISAVDLDFPYKNEDIPALLKAAEHRANNYDLKDALAIVDYSNVIFSLKQELTETRGRESDLVRQLEYAKKQLTAAQQVVTQYEKSLIEYRHKVDKVLEGLDRYVERKPLRRSPVFNFRRMRTRTHSIPFTN